MQDVLRRGTLLTPVETKWALELIGLDTKAIPGDDTVAGLTISRFTTELTWANLNELRPRQFERLFQLLHGSSQSGDWRRFHSVETPKSLRGKKIHLSGYMRCDNRTMHAGLFVI